MKPYSATVFAVTPNTAIGVSNISQVSMRSNIRTANTTAAHPMSVMTAHRRFGDEVTLVFTFGPLVLKEFAELDQRVEQRLRDLILV